MLKEQEPKLGQRARDIVTGIEGIIIGISSWLTGCNTCGIKPPVRKDGTNPDVTWVDEMRVEVLDSVSIFDKRTQPDLETGGPAPTPQQYPS